MRIAVVTDTNSSISVDEAKKLGVFVVPMPFTISGVEYLEDISLDKEEFYRRQKDGEDIVTSQPSPASVMDIWDNVLKEYDQIIHIPMSSSLSGSCETAIMLATDDAYDGKVFVVDNKRISITQRASVIEALNMISLNKSAQEIKEYLEMTSADSSIYLVVDTLKYLKKGGRITAAAAALGTLLKIKPVLTFQGGKIDAWSKARTLKQAKSVMLTSLLNDIKDKFKIDDLNEVNIYIAHSNADESAQEFGKECKEFFEGYKKDIKIYNLSLSVSTHVGPGVLAVGAVNKSDYIGDDN